MSSCTVRRAKRGICVAGSTMPIKWHLRYLGGRWDPVKSEWVLPFDKEDLARRLVGDDKTPFCLGDYHEMTDAGLSAFVEAQEWKFAKSMPHIPHWYVVRKSVGDDELYNSFVMAVHQRGVVHSRRGFRRLYMDFDGFCYWTMDPPTFPANFTELVNRARIDEKPSPKRTLAFED